MKVERGTKEEGFERVEKGRREGVEWGVGSGGYKEA
jgi:hypothetical protein